MLDAERRCGADVAAAAAVTIAAPRAAAATSTWLVFIATGTVAPSGLRWRPMPEGDSLHRAARLLEVLVGEGVAGAPPHPRAAAERIAERLDGRRLESVEAVGKNLLLSFEGGVGLARPPPLRGRRQG